MMKATTLNRIGGAVGLGCLACCVTPVLGLMNGLVGLSAVSIIAGVANFWWLALTIVVLSVGALVYRNVSQKQSRCANIRKPCKGAECSGR
ncbi:hypothetical protein PMA3_06370 [Pseudomonas silesiensis]|uniref:Uncharacterized protein n=1 Tax=Pseudomonas silesiensis TaxID=1853130 RepID=A0A191YPK7_9PSED|nr:hypothetical protein PMA3_06370 [Pseudomonas silesiensis]